MNKPIRVRMRIEEDDILRLGQDAAFVQALTEWEALPWIKFLREHGEINHVEHYNDFNSYARFFTVHWQLPGELKTWFYLNYSDQIQG